MLMENRINNRGENEKKIVVCSIILSSIFSYSESFEIITLGSNGGVNDGNLSKMFF
ncbi:MAG: hypothetical protein ACRC0S_03340 [Fusobacteriaceae bacterium]